MTATLITLVSPAAQNPPTSVIPTKTMAVAIMPAWNVKTPGISDERIAPPATYCSEVTTIWSASWPITPSTRPETPKWRSNSSLMVVNSRRR